MNFEDCFLILLQKNISLLQIFSQVFTKGKTDPSWYFVFYFSFYFSDHYEFSLTVLPGILFYSMQVKYMPSTTRQSQTAKNPSYEKYGYYGVEKFDEELRYHLLCMKFFHSRNFQRPRKVSLRNGSVLLVKQFLTRNCDTSIKHPFMFH